MPPPQPASVEEMALSIKSEKLDGIAERCPGVVSSLPDVQCMGTFFPLVITPSKNVSFQKPNSSQWC